MTTPGGDKPLYPNLQQAREVEMNHLTQNDTARDEEMARRLQAQYDQGNVMSVAQAVPQPEMPYKCGNCSTAHAVRNVTHGSTFQCTVCGAQNQILLEHRRPVVVVLTNGGLTDIPVCSVCLAIAAETARMASYRSRCSAPSCDGKQNCLGCSRTQRLIEYLMCPARDMLLHIVMYATAMNLFTFIGMCFSAANKVCVWGRTHCPASKQ